MRIALFGGSFDPPHAGHIGIALAAVERLRLDRVLMAPVGRQPLKRDRRQSPYPDRLAMVELACAGHPPLATSSVDAPRIDGRFNYTFDTLQSLRETLQPGDELFCLIGADSLETLRHWHRVADALLLAQWIVAARPGFTLAHLQALLPEGIETGDPEDSGGCLRVPIAARLGEPRTGALWLLPDPHFEVSATALRAALAGQTAGIPRQILDDSVAAYAREHALYELH